MFVPFGFQQRFVTTSLGKMACCEAEASVWQREEEKASESQGIERSPLLFLHGFGGGSSSYEWSWVYPTFAADCRVLAPDLIGWGSSDRPERQYILEDYLNTIEEFIRNTCQDPVAVVASSLTAAILIRVAIVRPDLFRALVLVAPSGLSDFGEDYRRSFFAQLANTPIVDRLIYQTAIASENGIRTFLEQRQFGDHKRIAPEIAAAYLASAKQPNAEYAALSFVRGDLSFDLAAFLPDLKVPTAMLWGEKSQFTSPELGRKLANRNPEFVRIFQMIEGAGLTPQLEVPGITAGLIRKCLRSLLTQPR